MNELLLKLKNLAVKYREWFVILVLLGLIVFFLSLYRSLTYQQIEREVLGGAGAGRSQEEQLVYNEIVDAIMEVPTPYIDLVKFNPFIDIEVILEIQRELQEKYDEARRLYDAGSFLDARELFRELLQKDPYEARIDYRPYKPTTYIRRCEQEWKRQEIRGYYNQAVTLLERAQALDSPEAAANEEELLRNYEDCQKLFQRVVEEGAELLPEAVEDAKAKLQGGDEEIGVNQRVEQLQMRTFTATLSRLYDEAVEFWNRREQNLADVANANDNLLQARQLIADYPGRIPADALRVQEQIEELSKLIELEVDQRYASELQRASQLEQTAQGNLEQLSRAYDIYEVLYRLRQEDDVRQRMDELGVALEALRKQQMVEQARGWLAEARQLWQQAGQARDAGEWEQLETAKKEGLTLLARFEGLPETSELVTIRADAANLEADFQTLAVPPLIEGYVLSRASARSAVVEDPANNIRVFLGLGRRDPRSGMTYVRPGKTDASGEIQSIFVTKEGFRETEISRP